MRSSVINRLRYHNWNVPISFTSQLKISGSRQRIIFGKKYKMTSVLLHQLRNQPIL